MTLRDEFGIVTEARQRRAMYGDRRGHGISRVAARPVLPVLAARPRPPKPQPVVIIQPRPVHIESRFNRQMSPALCYRAVDAIVGAACAVLAVTPEQLTGRSRRHRIAYARHTAVYLIKWFTGMSLNEIARALNRADHTTFVRGLRLVSRRLVLDESRQRWAIAEVAARARLDDPTQWLSLPDKLHRAA